MKAQIKKTEEVAVKTAISELEDLGCVEICETPPYFAQKWAKCECGETYCVDYCGELDGRIVSCIVGICERCGEAS